MVRTLQPEVNGKPATLHIGDPGDTLSLAYATAQGYRITLDGDGNAEVLKADGTAYRVHEFRCDCPDAQGRRGGSYHRPGGDLICKHVAWVSQLRPCDLCGGTMALGEFVTAFGSRIETFECELCRNMITADLVRDARRARRMEVARCRS